MNEEQAPKGAPSSKTNGWHTDPSDSQRLRLWTGTQWSQWVFERGQIVSDPLPGVAPAESATPPDAPLRVGSPTTLHPRKGVRVWLIAGAAVAAGLAFDAFVAFVFLQGNGGSVVNGQVSVDKLKVGDCVALPKNGANSWPHIPCDQPHDGEVFARFGLMQDSWPGQENLDLGAEKDCISYFADYVGTAADQSSLSYSTITPDESAWRAGSRFAVCVAYDQRGKTTGTLRDSKR